MSFSRKEIRSLTKKLTLNRSLTLLTDYSKLHPTVIETVSILKTNPANRTENYLNTLVNLTKNVDFFKKINLELDENAHKMCCQYMKYCYFDDGKTLFNAGDKGDSFFIVISGEVKVFVPTKDQEDNRILTETCTLGDGQAFGELALIKDQPRAASIIVSRPSHFAVLEKKDYLRILGKYSAKKLEEFINFLSSLPAFST